MYFFINNIINNILPLLVLYQFISLIVYLVAIQYQDCRSFALQLMLNNFYIIFVLLIFFDTTKIGYNYLIYYSLTGFVEKNIFFGIDGMSLCFLWLTVFIFPLCVINEWTENIMNKKIWYFLLLFIESLLILAFISLDFFMFYIFFESLLIPMFLLIGIWGSRKRKLKATVYLVLYTVAGSFFLLFGIFLLKNIYGTTNIFFLQTFFESNQLRIACNNNYYEMTNFIVWLFLFIGFAVKIPMIPIHIWLPEAHVEAPTTGSIILAALLLKLGGYGFLRFLLPLLSWESYLLIKFLLWFALLSVIISNMAAFRQNDMKKLIAYSSIGHMNFSLIGIFTFSLLGISGGFLLMLGHGFISTALFLLVGILYNRFNTKLFSYLGGLSFYMPQFTFFFLFFLLSNFSFPLTANFIGEILILFEIVSISKLIFLFLSFSLIICAGYSIQLFNRVSLGTVKIQYVKEFKDLQLNELFCLIILMFLVLLLGIFPNYVLNIFLNTNFPYFFK